MSVINIKSIAATVLLGLSLAVTGCHSPDRSTGQAINDQMIGFNIDHALSKDQVLKYPDVHVRVYNGNAQLTGFVDTEEQRTRAAEIASGVQGVTQVINEITVKPAPTGRAQIHDVTRDQVQPQPPPR